MRIAGKTDTGLVRRSNQDDFAFGRFSDETVWAVVCDGMGGANGGNIASSTAVKVISENITAGYSPDIDTDGFKDLLLNSINAANKRVFDMARAEPSLFGMGTTVVAGLVRKDKAYIVHAGDSRAYLLSEGQIRQITRDHSIVQEMLECGKLTPDEAKIHPQKNIITRALGVEETLAIDYCTTDLKDNDYLLICTDGLSNHIETGKILETVINCGLDGSPEELIKLANDDGGSDNITVVVIGK